MRRWLVHLANLVAVIMCFRALWVTRNTDLPLLHVTFILAASFFLMRLSYLVLPHPRARGRRTITEVIRPAQKLKVKRPWE